MKKIFLLTLIAAIILAGGAGFVRADEEDDAAENTSARVTEVARDGTRTLLIDRNTGEFLVSDSQTGIEYSSNPRDKDDDAVRGVKKMQMYSQIYLSVYNSETEDERQLISYTGSVQQDGLSVKGLKNGAKLYYYFPEVKITVPLELRLENGVLTARINISDISQKGKSIITSISLLPFFACGGAQDEGYIIVPDGSGALINFNNQKSKYSPYSQNIYGNDLALSNRLSSGAIQENAMLPVFGIHKNGNGILSVVSAGEASASIHAYTNGMQDNQNTVYADFLIYPSDLIIIGDDAGGSAKDVKKFNTYKPLINECKIEYHFLAANESDYSGMAKKYAEYLGEKYDMPLRESSEYSMFVSLTSGFMKRKSFLGISYEKYESLTTFNEAKKITEALRKKGAGNLQVSLQDWSKKQAQGKNTEKISFSSVLDGKKGFSNLSASVQSLYLSYDPLLLSKGGNGFSTVTDAAKKVSGEKIQIYKYSPSTYFQNTNYKPRYVVKIPKLLEYSQKFLKSLNSKAKNTGVYSTQLGTFLSGNYSKNNPETREEMKNTITEILKSAKTEWILSKANAYALPFAQSLTDIPLGASEFDITDKSIPFYQMVAGRICDYYAPALNYNPSQKNLTLMKLLETGSLPCYDWIYSKSHATKETLKNDLYSSHYGDWISDAAEIYAEIKSVYKQAGSNILIRHEELAKDVYASHFEGGGSVILNYSDEIYENNGITVNPLDYKAVKH